MQPDITNIPTPANPPADTPEQNAKEALQILANAASQYRGTLQDHKLIATAAGILEGVVREHFEAPPKPESEAPKLEQLG